jgi:hypothetical protein
MTEYRPTEGPESTPAAVRVDAGHAAGPVIRFPRKDWSDCYTVWAVKDDGALICVARLDTHGDEPSAVASAVAWRARPDLGADVTAVVVSGPRGERVPTIGEG